MGGEERRGKGERGGEGNRKAETQRPRSQEWWFKPIILATQEAEKEDPAWTT